MTKQLLKAQCFINGEWVDGEGKLREVFSPIDGELLGTFYEASTEQVNQAIAAAKAAQKEWRNVSLREKCELLEKAARIGFEKYADDMARYMTMEMGKILPEAQEEVNELGIPNLIDAAEEAKRFRNSSPPSTYERSNNKKMTVKQEPIGVVGTITPWNFPISLPAEYIPYALVMGNTDVFKPTSSCPFSTQLFVKMFDDAGFPPGTINFVLGGGNVGSQFFTHPDVDCLTFTGSTEVGLLLSRECGLKRKVLELGGNGPMIVMDDADIDAAVDGVITGHFYNCGQVCCGAERTLVHEAIYDEFLEKFVAKASKLVVGDPFDPNTDIGPMHDQNGVDKVIEHMEDALAHGARIVTGGNHNGLYFEPTVMVDVPHGIKLSYTETFGPLAPLTKFKNREEAVFMANDTIYGLSSAVYTSGLQNAWYFADNLQHGTVIINENINYWDYLSPFGGAKQSGNGRILGSWILNCLSETKLVVMDTSNSRY